MVSCHIRSKHNREAFEAAMSGWDCERAFTHNYFETNGKNDVDVPCKRSITAIYTVEILRRMIKA